MLRSVRVEEAGGKAGENCEVHALSAAETSTRNELEQHGWLQKIGICATVQDGDRPTALGEPSGQNMKYPSDVV